MCSSKREEMQHKFEAPPIEWTRFELVWSREMFRLNWLLLLLLFAHGEVDCEQRVGRPIGDQVGQSPVQSWWPHLHREQKLWHYSRHKSRRQAATDEAIRELRILESQDGQLRAFADGTQYQRAQQRQVEPAISETHQPWPHPARDFRCHLTLMTNELWNKTQATPTPPSLEREQIELVNEMEGDNFCLRFPQLAAQIPPFMLNLYRQLAFDISGGGGGGGDGRNEQAQHLNFSETVQMMPYRAEIMRSFRQPKLAAASAEGAFGVGRLRNGRGDYDDELDALAAIWRPAEEEGALQSDGVRPQDKASNGARHQGQETLSGAADETRRRRWRRRRPHPQQQHHDAQDLVEPGEQTGNVVVELSVLNGSDEPKREVRASSRRRHHSQGPLASPACDLRQRLLPADQRDEICFWFRLDHELNHLVGGPNQPSLVPGGLAERLVEAELHVFKLFPQVLRRSSGQLDDQTSFPMMKQQFAHTNRTMSAANLYHLRTNLLEVSLYQILPKRLADKGQARGEFPLRLLDIRRIDLNSNGWETFYVKRAVTDWLKEPRSNLGFVIKAKSMFDEPIQVGLIRFADAYDEPEPAYGDSGARKRDAKAKPRGQLVEPLQARSNFSLSHQPLLVIYTTRNSLIGDA